MAKQRTKPAGRDLEIKQNIPQLGKLPPLSLPTGPADGFIRYRVTRPLSQLAHTEKVYPVKNGLVDLPGGETWYQNLITNGTLIKE